MTTAYTASNSLPMSALPTASGILQRFPANATNTGASTYAPDGLTASPIFGLGGQPLQGSEIVSGGNVTLVSYIGPLLNAGALCWVLLDCTGGAQQVAPALQSDQAMQLGQATGRLLNVQFITATGTYTPTSGTNLAIVEGCGGGGAGGGLLNPGVGNASAAGGGSAGAFGKIKVANPVPTTVVIGAAGVGTSGAAGTDGSQTSFGTLLVLPGGGGAPQANIVAAAEFTGPEGALSAVPTAVNGIGSIGWAGVEGFVLSISSGQGGPGGNSPYGSGGLLTSFNNVGAAFPGNAANGHGSGGSGALGLGNSATEAGGDGAPGLLIAWEYS